MSLFSKEVDAAFQGAGVKPDGILDLISTLVSSGPSSYGQAANLSSNNSEDAIHSSASKPSGPSPSQEDTCNTVLLLG